MSDARDTSPGETSPRPIEAVAPPGIGPEAARRNPTLASFRQVVPINAGVTIVNVTAVVLLLIGQIPLNWLLSWWLLHAAGLLYMLYRWVTYNRRAGRDQTRSARLRVFDIWGAAFSGIAWGSAALFLPQLDEAHRVLVIMVAAGMLSGSAATLAVVPNAAMTYMLLIAVPFVTFFLWRGGTLGISMAVMSALYTCAMIMTNRIVNGVIRRNRRLHEENTALYARIRAAQGELLDIAESTEAFAFLDAENRLLLWNRRLPTLLGLNEGLFVRGTPMQGLLRRAGLPDSLLDGELPGEAQGRALQLPNGRWLQVGRRVTPQGDRALIVIDITEQQEASARLRSQNTRLEELFREVSQARDAALRASQAKSIFLANMSHELRTPLNAIIGFSDIVQQKMFGPDWAKYDEYLHDINGSARHLLSVIDDILDLARIEANQIQLHEQPVMLDEELPICARLAASHYGRTVEAVQVSVPDDLPPLHADARLVRQILINLIGNALKFSPTGIPVEAEARLDAASNEILLKVTDRGIGIAPEDQARIFDAFEQADSQLSRKYGGVGLGLSLVRAFVRAHQGSIAIDSAPGRGTEITVSFPATRTGIHHAH